jgi:hypothetical protein
MMGITKARTMKFRHPLKWAFGKYNNTRKGKRSTRKRSHNKRSQYKRRHRGGTYGKSTGKKLYVQSPLNPSVQRAKEAASVARKAAEEAEKARKAAETELKEAEKFLTSVRSKSKRQPKQMMPVLEEKE